MGAGLRTIQVRRHIDGGRNILRVVSLQEGHLWGIGGTGGFGPCRLRGLRLLLRSRLGAREGLFDALDDGGDGIFDTTLCPPQTLAWLLISQLSYTQGARHSS